MSFVSGPYTWYYNGASVGIVEEAPRLRFVTSSETITGDNLGDTIQGVVNRGGNAFLDMVFQEWDNVAARAAFWPFSDTQGEMKTGVTASNGYTAIGCVQTGKVLHAAKLANSCATPDRIYALNAVLAPNQDLNYLLGSRHRNVGVSMLLMPWTDTAPGTNPQAPVNDPVAQVVTHVAGDNEMKFWAEWNAS